MWYINKIDDDLLIKQHRRVVYLQMIGGFDEHSGHQVGVSLQVVDALLCGSAENFDTISRGAQ